MTGEQEAKAIAATQDLKDKGKQLLKYTGIDKIAKMPL